MYKRKHQSYGGADHANQKAKKNFNIAKKEGAVVTRPSIPERLNEMKDLKVAGRATVAGPEHTWYLAVIRTKYAERQ